MKPSTVNTCPWALQYDWEENSPLALVGNMVNASKDRFLGCTEATEMNGGLTGIWILKGHFGSAVKSACEISSKG